MQNRATGLEGALSLRIALVLETSGGGSGRHVLDLARGLVARGHRVSVIYSPVRAEPRFVIALKAIEGVDVTELAMERSPSLSDFGAVRALRAMIQNAASPFDVLHAHSSKAGGLLRLAARGFPQPVIYTPHCLRTMDPTLHFPAREIIGFAEVFLSWMTDAIICVSEEEMAHATKLGIAPEKLHLVINGVGAPPAEARARLRAEHGIAEETVVIGFLGRYVPQKAPQRMLDVLGRLVQGTEGNAPFKIAMVGEGPLEATLKADEDARRFADRLLWLPGSIGPEAMRMFDVFAMPSAYEGMPYVLLEAAASGLPIVATEVGGTSAIVGNERNGYVVENWDPPAFADRLGALVRDSGLRKRMAAQSLEAAESFTIDAMIERTVGVYDHAISERRARRRNG